jgi:hypothetical protein
MSTLVNNGTMSVLKLVAMRDTSSTLSCDTARPVSRVGDGAVELAPRGIHLSAWRHGIGGYSHTVFTFFADAVLIRPFIAESAHAETAPL